MSSGIRGEKGERGEIGLRGEFGEKGERGEQGSAGERGKDGLQGNSSTPEKVEQCHHDFYSPRIPWSTRILRPEG